MRAKVATLSILSVIAACSIATVRAKPRHDPPQRETARQIVIRVHKSQDGPEYEVKSYNLKKREANFLLAELKLRECGDCQIIPIVDDNVELRVVTQISEMAINAGFKDIRPFVFWRSTGRMAQIEFGPLIKFTENATKIEQRTEKAK